MISDELLEEVIHVSLRDEIIDQDLLIKIIDNIIGNCEQSTKSKFNGVEIFKEYRKEKKTNAEYLDEDKIIRVFYLNIAKNGINIRNLSVFQTNLYMIQVILHEIEHLKADTIELKDDFEGKLLLYSSPKFIWDLLSDNLNDFIKKYKKNKLVEKYLINKYNKFTCRTWELCPDEKMAEANSTKILLDVATGYHNFDKKYSEEYQYLKKEYVRGLATGYCYLGDTELYNVPLLEYLDELNNIDVFGKVDPLIYNELENTENYTLEEKMKYGLSLEEGSIKVLKKKYQIED